MAQHDYDIANQSGANFRADLNNALDAIVSNNSGSSQPSTTFAYEWWIDTSANLLKLRNSANNAWITLPLSITASNETSGALTVNGNLTTTGILDADGGVTVDNITIDGTEIDLSSGDLTIDVAGNIQIDADDNGEVRFLDGGTQYATIKKDGNNALIQSIVADGDLVFQGIDGSSFVTAMQIDMSEAGRVGIGTTTPSMKVDIKGDNGDQLRLDNDGDRFTQLTLANNTTTKANFNFDNTDSLAEIFAVSGAGLKLSTNGSESMRIASDGKVLINTTSTVGTSTALVEFNNLGSGGRILNTKDNGTGSCNAITFNNNNGQVGRITTSGSSTSYVQSSDYRIKENLVYDWEALPKIKDLKPAQFNFKTNTDEIVEGFIAHEAQSVVPYAVVGKKDGEEMQGMDYGKLTAILTKAIQELEERVKTLEG
tara:strand:- start:1595 stop:2875 length:1281 start_codon:yes stop_codon:yes gene_type:complete